MRHFTPLAALSLALFSASCATTTQTDPALAADASQRVSVILGQRFLDDDFFEGINLDELPSIALEFSNGGASDSVGYELGFSYSRDSEDQGVFDEVDLSVSELYGGVRKEFGADTLRPFVGLGVSVRQANVEIEQTGFADTEVDDTVFGGYVHAGVNIQVADGFSVLVDGRAFFGEDYDFEGAEISSQSIMIGLGVGISL